jgi:carbon monoxide dehydrogenase subunit G
MASARKARTIAADPQSVWELVDDPHHLPRWWPGVKRMEGVGPEAWTEVHITKKGRPVRIDFRLLESTAPGTDGAATGRRAWEQEIVGTPFERVLVESIVEVSLESVEGGTRVTLEQHQKLKGYSRAGGGLMLRRATAKKLDEALNGLERVCA